MTIDGLVIGMRFHESHAQTSHNMFCADRKVFHCRCLCVALWLWNARDRKSGRTVLRTMKVFSSTQRTHPCINTWFAAVAVSPGYLIRLEQITSWTDSPGSRDNLLPSRRKLRSFDYNQLLKNVISSFSEEMIMQTVYLEAIMAKEYEEGQNHFSCERGYRIRKTWVLPRRSFFRGFLWILK